MDTIPALSICQPWPWMILAGHKVVENRTWSVNYRGPLAIHASKSRSWVSHVAPLRESGYPIPPTPQELAKQAIDDDPLPFGAFVGVVELIDVVEIVSDDRYGLADDPFATGPYCWILANPRALAEPIPARGRASLFHVDASFVAELL